ncbi:hypothetical protein [Marinobacter sp. MBR-105]|jgi:hypothetical protein
MDIHQIRVGQTYHWNDTTAWSSDGQSFERSGIVTITRKGSTFAYGVSRQGHQIAVIEIRPETLSPIQAR